MCPLSILSKKVSMSKQNIQMRTRNLPATVLAIVLATAMLAACGGSSSPTTSSPTTTTTNQSSNSNKIQHVIVIMQENRSFDSYFGTYPGADGIPAGVCIPDPDTGGCQKPFHDANDENGGGPHTAEDATADIDGGKMDGFVATAERGRHRCTDQIDPRCAADHPDVMGYHTRD